MFIVTFLSDTTHKAYQKYVYRVEYVEVLGFFNCKTSLYNEVNEKYFHLSPFLDWLGCSSKIVYISKC